TYSCNRTVFTQPRKRDLPSALRRKKNPRENTVHVAEGETAEKLIVQCKKYKVINVLRKSAMHNFRELDVWKKAVELTTAYYKVSKKFPKEEIFGLTSQSRRSLISISSNIAEGAGRDSSKQFLQFLSISLASSFEFET